MKKLIKILLILIVIILIFYLLTCSLKSESMFLDSGTQKILHLF
jgi:hypothetical protein